MRPNWFAPCAGSLSALSAKAGGKTRPFNRLDGADRKVVVAMEIDRTPGGLQGGGDLLLDFGRAREAFLDGVRSFH
jgi:hypothetical protein